MEHRVEGERRLALTRQLKDELDGLVVHRRRQHSVDEYLQKEQEVKTWLEELLSIELPVLFLPALRDGVLLCFAMLAVYPRSIPKVHIPPDNDYVSASPVLETIHQSMQPSLSLSTSIGLGLGTLADVQEEDGARAVIDPTASSNAFPFFLVKRNLSFFLAACEDELYIPKKAMFSVFDLHRGLNDALIVEGIHFFLRLAAATKPPRDETSCLLERAMDVEAARYETCTTRQREISILLQGEPIQESRVVKQRVAEKWLQRLEKLIEQEELDLAQSLASIAALDASSLKSDARIYEEALVAAGLLGGTAGRSEGLAQDESSGGGLEHERGLVKEPSEVAADAGGFAAAQATHLPAHGVEEGDRPSHGETSSSRATEVVSALASEATACDDVGDEDEDTENDDYDDDDDDDDDLMVHLMRSDDCLDRPMGEGGAQERATSARSETAVADPYPPGNIAGGPEGAMKGGMEVMSEASGQGEDATERVVAESAAVQVAEDDRELEIVETSSDASSVAKDRVPAALGSDARKGSKKTSKKGSKKRRRSKDKGRRKRAPKSARPEGDAVSESEVSARTGSTQGAEEEMDVDMDEDWKDAVYTPMHCLMAKLIQSAWRLKLARSSFLQRVRNEAYRQKVSNEILATEKSYVHRLRLMQDVFISKLLHDEELNIQPLQVGVTIILGYSEILLKKLSTRIKDWSHRQCLGDVFLMMSDYIKTYTQYVKDYTQLLTRLMKRKQDPAFVALLRKLERHPRMARLRDSFQSFLIMPVQRIPRYCLLLGELVRYTDASHPDVANLRKAEVKMKEVADYVNERQNDFEAVNKVIAVHDMFGSLLTERTAVKQFIRSHRRFILELQIKNADNERLDCFLFNDLFLLAKKPGKESPPEVRRIFLLRFIDVVGDGGVTSKLIRVTTRSRWPVILFEGLAVSSRLRQKLIAAVKVQHVCLRSQITNADEKHLKKHNKSSAKLPGLFGAKEGSRLSFSQAVTGVEESMPPPALRRRRNPIMRSKSLEFIAPNWTKKLGDVDLNDDDKALLAQQALKYQTRRFISIKVRREDKESRIRVVHSSMDVPLRNEKEKERAARRLLSSSQVTKVSEELQKSKWHHEMPMPIAIALRDIEKAKNETRKLVPAGTPRQSRRRSAMPTVSERRELRSAKTFTDVRDCEAAPSVTPARTDSAPVTRGRTRSRSCASLHQLMGQL